MEEILLEMTSTEDICLMDLMSEQKDSIELDEQLRDISTVGLKTVIEKLGQNSNYKKITDFLVNVINQNIDLMNDEFNINRLEAIEILTGLLKRFGSLLDAHHAVIQDALFPQLLCFQWPAVPGEAITALSYLMISCSQQLYSRAIEYLIKELTGYVNNKDINSAKTYIQCITAISRQSGHRFGKYLERVMPLITKLMSIDIKEVDKLFEMKEVCFQAYESFVRHTCPKEISSQVPTITNVCLQYLSYNPNHSSDSGLDDEDMEMDNEEEEADTDGSYSDDDDMSWKVRRASAKTLEALISSRHELVAEFYKKVSPELISRFNERQESVKIEVFIVYIELLKQIGTVMATGCHNSLEFFNSVPDIVGEQVPSIVKLLDKQLEVKSIEIRQNCFTLLSELVNVLPGALTDHISNLIPGILYSLSDRNSSFYMKIETLAFLNVLLKNHSPDVFHKHIHILLPAVVNAVSDSFYKITSEALLVLTQLRKVIRTLVETELNYKTSSNFDFTPFIQLIYDSTIVKLKTADINQEVKERAITCMGQIVHTFGDKMQSELQVILQLLLDGLRNETRLTCVEAITKIASSQFKLNLNPLLPEAFPVLASFLRKNQRGLKMSSLQLINTFVKNYSEYFIRETIGLILGEVVPLIDESNLPRSQLTLNMLTSLIGLDSSVLTLMATKHKIILKKTMVLVRSPILQASALNSMLEFFQVIVQNSFKGLDYEELVAGLTQRIYKPDTNLLPIHKKALHSIAKCMSAISIIDENRAISTVRKLLDDIRNHQESDLIQQFALLAIGEIGKTIDLSSVKDLKAMIVALFYSSSEEVESAVSFCLGSVSVGNLAEYLPFVLSQIESRQKRQYLLLNSLKEIISCQSENPQTISVLDSIWKLLLNHCECPEEGPRNVVVECLGKLTLIDPINLLPRLQKYLLSESPLARSTVVTAMKFTISDQPQKIDALLMNTIGDFLRTLQDPDINVRRVALVAFNCAAHKKPSLIRDLLDSILPQLYNETKIRKELIREVEEGPHIHTIDEGLYTRKAAFECMYTLLDSCLDRIDIFELLNHVEDGLRDYYDIKILTYLIIIRLSTLCPSALLQRLERLVEPLKSICVADVNPNAVEQQFEKHYEMKWWALRVFSALLAIPDADKNILMTDFLSQIKSTKKLSILYEKSDQLNVNQQYKPYKPLLYSNFLVIIPSFISL